MGYAAEKQISDKKVHAWKVVGLFAAIIILIVALIVDSILPVQTWKFYFALPEITKRSEGEMRIHFVDVGQGDATIVELPDGKTMLIDGGNGMNETEKILMRYLNALGIVKLDYLVLTHADSDHCGALDTVIEYKEVGKVFLPVAEETANEEYAEFYAQFAQKGCDWAYSKCGITLGNKDGAYPYTLSFIHPYSVDEDEKDADSNAQSAVLWLDYNGVSALFTGDIPQSMESVLTVSHQHGMLTKYGVDLSSTEILKVAHHGSADSTSGEFLDYLNVKTAVVSCGVDNSYNHPMPDVLYRLNSHGVQTYRTDTQGGVIVSVEKDGNDYAVETLGK